MEINYMRFPPPGALFTVCYESQSLEQDPKTGKNKKVKKNFWWAAIVPSRKEVVGANIMPKKGPKAWGQKSMWTNFPVRCDTYTYNYIYFQNDGILS